MPVQPAIFGVRANGVGTPRRLVERFQYASKYHGKKHHVEGIDAQDIATPIAMSAQITCVGEKVGERGRRQPGTDCLIIEGDQH